MPRAGESCLTSYDNFRASRRRAVVLIGSGMEWQLIEQVLAPAQFVSMAQEWGLEPGYLAMLVCERFVQTTPAAQRVLIIERASSSPAAASCSEREISGRRSRRA
jgi:hypothetical protein